MDTRISRLQVIKDLVYAKGSDQAMQSVKKSFTYAFLTRAWEALYAPLKLILITLYFTPELQGFHYTFLGIITLQGIAEMGFTDVIVHFSAHEWASLSWDGKKIQGDRAAQSRLFSLGKIVFKWFSIAALIIGVVLSCAGLLFFRLEAIETYSLTLPWITLCIANSLSFALFPVWAILEGCNQLEALYRYRFINTIVVTIATCLGIILGFGLWVAAISLAAGVLWSLIFITARYGSFFREFLQRQERVFLSWKGELWPMQWRMALSSIAGNLSYQLFSPIIFFFFGSTSAGKVGMTLAMVRGVDGLATLLLNLSRPKFGALIAKREYLNLQKLYVQMMRSTLFMSLGALGLAYLFIQGVTLFIPRFTDRMLLFPERECFFIAGMLFTVAKPISIYLRAHKQEPLLILSLLFSTLFISSHLITGYMDSLFSLSFCYALLMLIYLFCQLRLRDRFTIRYWGQEAVVL